MQKWEYKYVAVLNSADIPKILNEYGAEGWELVFWNNERTFIFRRTLEI